MLLGSQGCSLTSKPRMNGIFDRLHKYRSRKSTCEAPETAVRVAQLLFRRREKTMESLLNPTPTGRHPLVCMALTNRPPQLWTYILRNWKTTPDMTYWETVKVILEYDSVEQLDALMKGVQSRDIVGEEYTKGVNILHLAVDNLAERCTAYILGWPNVRTGCPRPEFPMENCTACLLYTSPSPRDGLLSRMPSSA